MASTEQQQHLFLSKRNLPRKFPSEFHKPPLSVSGYRMAPHQSQRQPQVCVFLSAPCFNLVIVPIASCTNILQSLRLRKRGEMESGAQTHCSMMIFHIFSVEKKENMQNMIPGCSSSLRTILLHQSQPIRFNGKMWAMETMELLAEWKRETAT